MKILWISFVWPEPGSSAAGLRTLQLIESCRSAGFEVRVCSPCQLNVHRDRLEEQGILTARFEPNDSSFDTYVSEYNPDIVFFDRFMIEEQFGWRVKERCPDALRVLDTIDLHSLRRARQQKVEQGEILREFSDSELQSEDAIREISSIYRSDLSLIVSNAEMDLLQNRYGVPLELLELCRFFYPKPASNSDYDGRCNFVAIGNFNHQPNADSYRILQNGLWASIQARLKDHGMPHAELHIYGAYPTKEFMSLDDPSTGFRVKGWAQDAQETLSHYRVNLAPLRFGAGIKGKISDGWAVGTPCVATSIAAEGMHAGFEFGGAVEDDWEQFAIQAAKLYSQQTAWHQASERGGRIIAGLFNREINSSKFIGAIARLSDTRQARRLRNFVGAMLWHHQHRSTEFFSRWIETKRRLTAKDFAVSPPIVA